MQTKTGGDQTYCAYLCANIRVFDSGNRSISLRMFDHCPNQRHGLCYECMCASVVFPDSEVNNCHKSKSFCTRTKGLPPDGIEYPG